MRLVIVAAVASNGVIGNQGALPWGHFPEDLAHFKRLTMGAAVIMGRRTWDSLPAAVRPLPGRRNVVLSRDPAWRAPGVIVASSLCNALALLRATGEPVVYVIGGAQVYAEALSLGLADELALTEIAQDFAGDTRFPDFDRSSFHVEAQTWHRAAPPNGFAYAVTNYRGA
ncbi:dihydrofolate reductase [Azohydromonas aeria]|uniref:dihydrofolate reductase n=1 Tax=Azohydromonas aeria TaxID=2590212 RepID=UPI0012F8F445|nr:dihydrofolate reductase [Azohydromonas aeria]